MKEMKKSTKALIIIPVTLILFIVLLLNWDNIVYSTYPKYEYTSSGYATGSTLSMNGVIYEEISEDTFNSIYQEMVKQGIYPFSNCAIGRIDYKFVDESWKYTIYGNTDLKERILLKGEEAYSFNDVNFPEVYFCRQDILNSYKATESK